MKINLDIAILAGISLAILSFLAGALSQETPADKFRRQHQLEQHAIQHGNAVEV